MISQYLMLSAVSLLKAPLIRQLITIGQLRAQQARDFLTFPGGRLANTARPSIKGFNYGSYAEFQQANNEYIAAAGQAQNQINAIFQGFQAELGLMLAQQGFEFNDIRQHLASADQLRAMVNALGLHTFYPSLDQAIEFVIKAGRFISNNVVGDPLAAWGGNPSFAGSSGPNCYGHVTGPACAGRAVSTPGDYSGIVFGNNHIFELNKILAALVSDGLSLTPVQGGYPLFLVLSDKDYHFYRQDNDGTWSHKPGGMRKKRVDAWGNLITDPTLLNFARHGGYCPVCFFWAPPGFNADNVNFSYDPDNPGKPRAKP